MIVTGFVDDCSTDANSNICHCTNSNVSPNKTSHACADPNHAVRTRSKLTSESKAAGPGANRRSEGPAVRRAGAGFAPAARRENCRRVIS